MDAMSPGAASSPQAAAPAAVAVDTLQYFNRMVDLVERNFLNMSDSRQELTVNIGIAEACPIQPGAKVNVGVTVKQALKDQMAAKDFENVLKEFYNGLTTSGTVDQQAAARNTLNQVIQMVATPENLISIATSTINYQSGNLNIAVCRADSPLKMDEHLVASAIVNNILMQIGDKMQKGQSEGVKTSCPTQAAVMTLGSDGKPNGILTGPGQTITRGTADTYEPGKVRMYGPIAINGVGKQAGSVFNIQLDNTPCEGTDLEIGNWAKFDVKKPTQSEGVKTVGEGQMSQSSVQTSAEVSCKPRGFATSNRSVCCSGNTRFDMARARSECT
jgi:hypothetical protein